MPWTVRDVDRFKKGLTPGQKKKWVEIANGSLAECRLKGGDRCEEHAVRIANAKVGVREAQKYISKATEGHGTGVEHPGGPDTPENTPKAKERPLVASETEMTMGKLKETNLEIHGVLNLEEARTSRDGVMPVKVIEPGWGSSGYYGPNILERDAQVFEGVQMFWDHPRKSDNDELPERSLNDLAGVLHGVHWQEAGPDGPGVYGHAKVFSPFKERMQDLAPHIGLSILASGTLTEGEVEGREGPVIEAITQARSVDFVTVAGAGGKVVSLFESLREGNTDIGIGEEVQDDMDTKQLQESLEAKETELSEARKSLEEANTKLAEAQSELARYREADLVREARTRVEEKVKDAQIHDMAKARIIESLSTNPPVKEGALDTEVLDTKVEETVKAEADYLAKVLGSGKVQGLGGSEGTDTDDVAEAETKISDAFGRMGLSESESKIATQGR